MANTAYAEPVPWRGNEIHVAVEGKPLKEVLRDFCASQGITASISDDVQGTVSGRFETTAQRFWDTLASTFGFVWFYHGGLLSVSSSNDVVRQTLQLNSASVTDLKHALRNTHLDNVRFPITYNDKAKIAIVSGPIQYVRLVESVAKQLDDSVQRSTGSTVVRVFKLNSAWASDHKVRLDGKDVIIPGIATVLMNLYHPNSSGGAIDQSKSARYETRPLQQLGPMSDGSSAPVLPPLPALMSSGDSRNGRDERPNSGGSVNIRSGSATGALVDSSGQLDNFPQADQTLPVIIPDPTTNSVIIRDLPGRVGQYASLIDRLDARPKLIEIEAHIIEIDDDLLREIGVDWRANSSHLDFQTGNGSQIENSYSAGAINPHFGSTMLPGDTTFVSATPVGGAITAVLGNAGRYLLARISALESTRLARIEASPKVATLDNVEAVMDSKATFFVPVQGYTAGNLYTVSTGVSLRVLPMVVSDGDGTRIKLGVHIEDGRLTGQTVATLPVISNSEISTEAFIREGQSLLIAGYSADDDANGVVSVPWISKIPIIGFLFRSTNRKHNHMEQLFLITPRILSL